jgi:threonyl-tRNA synthetase
MKKQNLDNLRHSCAHLLAAAVMELYPDTKRTIGPAIEDGFYFDFEFSGPISEEDLPSIEKKMREITPSWKSFERFELSTEKAKKEYPGNEYKHELIDEFSKKGESLTFYKSGDYWDLCRGGHCESPDKELMYFKLLSIAGAYWRGNEKNKMLTRIYGTCFSTQNELDEYLWKLEEAKKRDHRKLGVELDLFAFSDLVGKGLPLYLPKGALMRRLLNEYIESEQSKQGYEQVWTPQINKAELFKISGHYDKYRENLFKVTSNYSDEEFFLKPMNCPQHTQIYAAKPRSYRDLPLRFTDFAMLYRDEKPGELNGLARVRSFSQDDCHVFCTENQVDEEADRALTMIKKIMTTFGFKYRYRLSTRDKNHPEKYVGSQKVWDKLEAWAEQIVKRNKIEYFEGSGEAAFYGPKMDLMATDALGREWQLSTLQIDFFMPERFNLSYIDRDGIEKRPVMLHRAIIGSSERFMMVLIEHYAGVFPLWLAPVQMNILPVSDKFQEYAVKLKDKLKKEGFRVELNAENKTLGAKIRESALQKVPYMVIIGEREFESYKVHKVYKVAVRTREGKDLGLQSFEKFINTLKEHIEKFQ